MTVSLQEFLAAEGPWLDVRSPKEFAHAHIPGAISLPLFSDEERALVGTAYKKEGKDIAIRIGIKIVGPKLSQMLSDAEQYIGAHNKANVYCWRGGMRSGFIRYFLDFAGIASLQLRGGYKTFRRHALKTLEKPAKFFIVGGLTGSGKTEVLEALAQQNNQVLDLEALACHRGSVYGELAGCMQPSSEQFENKMAAVLSKSNLQLPIWVEDESRSIGRCQIPGATYEAMQKAPLYVINSPKEARIARILSLYSTFSIDYLKEATQKLAKRLGGASTKAAVSYIEQGNLVDAICLLLDYYDKAYLYGISKHQGDVIYLPEQECSAADWAKCLQAYSRG